MSESAQSTLTTRDDGTFIRTAIVIDRGLIATLDVVGPEGQLFATVNMFRFDEKRGRICIDVIPARKDHDAQTITFGDHGRIFNPLPTGAALVAIDFKE